MQANKQRMKEKDEIWANKKGGKRGTRTINAGRS